MILAEALMAILTLLLTSSFSSSSHPLPAILCTLVSSQVHRASSSPPPAHTSASPLHPPPLAGAIMTILTLSGKVGALIALGALLLAGVGAIASAKKE